MRTPLCERLGLEYPIFAFTHCRDVVAAVSQAGGLGVLGAVGFEAEQLAQELEWIDAHIGDKPYAVDMVIPQQYEGIGEMDPAKLEAQLKAAIPREHVEFADRILTEHGVPEQVVGQINGERTCRGVIFDLVSEYVDAMERLNALLPGE